MSNLASGYRGTTEGQGEARAGYRAHGPSPTQFYPSLGSPSHHCFLSSLPLRKECLKEFLRNDTENGLPGSKAEEKAPTKV